MVSERSWRFRTGLDLRVQLLPGGHPYILLLVLATMPVLVDKFEGENEDKQKEEEGRKH